jgi:iron complex transport system substrate-binding protein
VKSGRTGQPAAVAARSRRTGVVAAVAGLALMVACGDSSSRSSDDAMRDAEAGAFPVTVEDATGTVTVRSAPRRIVSLSPSATETLFALGAGAQVVAVDQQSDFPAEAPRTDLSAYQPNVEAIAEHRPDLVVAPADVPRDLIAGLRRLGLTVLAEPAPGTLDDAYHQIREIGEVTGHGDAGRRLAADIRGRVERLIASAPATGSMTVFHELDPELFSASSQTFIGRIYKRLGLENIADPAARRAGNPYPQLSSEAVVSADPDLIVLADSECCDQTPAAVRTRPGWDGVSAVRRDAVVAIDDDIASRWGPRVPLFVQQAVEAIERARSG